MKHQWNQVELKFHIPTLSTAYDAKSKTHNYHAIKSAIIVELAMYVITITIST